MTAVEVRANRVAVVRRVADELTREDLKPRQYQAALRNHRRRALQKDGGFFVFRDLPPSPPDYEVEFEGRQFQRRRLTLPALDIDTLPPSGAARDAALFGDGEDELHVIITGAVTGNRVSFAMIPFVPRIADGAEVIGEGAFTTTLREPVEGVDIDGAELVDVTGLADGQALRIVRSRRLLLRPGPYYPFPEGTTVAAIHVEEAATGNAPIADVAIEITEVNAAAVAPVIVDGVTLFHADLPPTPTPFMIGTLEALGTYTNARGDAVFYYYAANTPVTSLTVSVSKTGYVTQTPTVAVTAGARTHTVVPLVRS